MNDATKKVHLYGVALDGLYDAFYAVEIIAHTCSAKEEKLLLEAASGAIIEARGKLLDAGVTAGTVNVTVSA